MTALNTLLLNYFLVLLANAILSGFCLYYYKDKLYKYSLGMWLATAAMLVASGVFQDNQFLSIISFSSYFGVILIQLLILSTVTRVKLPLRRYTYFMMCCWACVVVVHLQTHNFFWTAVPAVIGMCGTTAHGAWRALMSAETQSNRGGTRIYCGILLFHALHQLDFPFLRQDPAYAVLGFSVALTLLIAFSIFLPSYIIKDISDRHAEELLRLNEKMLGYQNQLTEAMSFASLGEMSYSFVHDMATPTTVLVMYASQLSEALKAGQTKTDTRDKILNYAETIEKATHRLFKMQDLFRSMARRRDPTAKVITADLRTIAKECADLCEPLLTAKKVALDFNCSAGDLKLETFEGCFETILLNLLQNAINAATSAIDVEDRRVGIHIARTGGSVVLQISDTGTGIPEERMKNLWERRGHSSGSGTLRQQSGTLRGTGFGLSNIKKVVDLLEGKIDVKTSPKGTVFTITFSEKLSVRKAS